MGLLKEWYQVNVLRLSQSACSVVMWHLRQSWAQPQFGASYPTVQSPLGEYCKDTPQLITPRKTRVEICFIQGHWAFFRRSHHILHFSHPGPLPEQKPRMVRSGGLMEEPFGCWFFPAFLSSLWERQDRGQELLWCRPLKNPLVTWQWGTLPEPTGVCCPAQGALHQASQGGTGPSDRHSLL